MKKTVLSALVALAMPMMASSAQAFEDIDSNDNIAYWKDSDNHIVRDRWGGCVRTIDWTKERAIAKCEGWPEVKPAVVAVPVKVVEPQEKKAVEAVVVAPAVVVEDPKTKAAVVIVEDVPAAFSGLFETNSFNLKPEAKQKLDAYADYMKKHPDVKVKITGYTDDRGAAAYNQKLSEKRAKAVKQYLESQGIDANRVAAEGKGEANPVADNGTAEGRAKNRRVELEIQK